MIVEVCPKSEKMLFLRRKAQGRAEGRCAMACGTVNGKPLTDKENQEHQRQETTSPSQNAAREGAGEVEQQHEVQQRVEALAHKLAQTYEELTRLLERNPGMKMQITEGATKED